MGFFLRDLTGSDPFKIIRYFDASRRLSTSHGPVRTTVSTANPFASSARR